MEIHPPGIRLGLGVQPPTGEAIDVLLYDPQLVYADLDLVDLPTVAWCELDYWVYTMRQASRWSWRIGQTKPVKVVFMAYRNSLQADALKLVAKKLQSSLAVEEELPEDGLETYGDDLMPALARKAFSERKTRNQIRRCSPRPRSLGERRGVPGGRGVEGGGGRRDTR